MGRKQGHRLEHFNKAYGRIAAGLPTLSESAQKLELSSQTKLWEKSKCRKALDVLQDLLLEEEAALPDTQQEDLGICLEHAFEVGVFDTIASFGQLDRPAGLLAAVLRLYTALMARIHRQALMPSMAFHRSVTSLLLTIAENLKKGVQFYEVDRDTLNFLHIICLRVHQNPLLLDILLVKDTYQAYEYLPIPILLYYFKQQKYEGDAKMREIMLLCVQIDNREVLQRLLGCTDFISSLVLKLESCFRLLPEKLTFAGLAPVKQPELNLAVFEEYCRFLNEICEKCLWQDLLSSLSVLLNYNFCDRVLSPRLASSLTYPTTMYVSASQYLSRMVKNTTSLVLLRTISGFLSGNKTQQDSTESPSLQIKRLPRTRQFQSYDSLMYTTGHTKNSSSISTAQETPTKTHVLAEAYGRDHSKMSLPSLLPETGNVWPTVLSYLVSNAPTEGRRMTLLFLRSCAKKGDLETMKSLLLRDMKHIPGQAKSQVTKEEFVLLFHIKTRCRLELQPKDYFKAAQIYCQADQFVYESEVVLSPLPLPIESDSFYDQKSDTDQAEGSDPYETPDKSQHERTGTTVYHTPSSSYAPAVVPLPFSPGMVVESLVRLLSRLLSESVEDGKLVMVVYK